MRAFLLIALLLGCSSPVAAELLTDIETAGHLKSLNLYLDRVPASSAEGLLSSASARVEIKGRLTEDYDFELAAEQRFLWSDPPGLVSIQQNSVNRLLEAEKSWSSDDRFAGQLQLDRFNLQGDFAETLWTVGRQAIGFGRISLFSPLDVIAPFPPDALDVDVRPGVDAIRLNRYFGLGGQLGAVAVFGDQPRNNSYLMTFSENIGQADLLVLAGSLRDRPMLGFGLAGELGPVGLKGELSWYRGQRVGQSGGDLRRQFAIGAFELWYRFNNGLVLLAEYLYNGPGSDEPADYPVVAGSAPLSEGLTFLLARHYLLLGPSYELHPLVTANGLVIFNMQDSSCLLRPQLAVSLSDNLQLDLFWAVAVGDKPALQPVTGLPLTRSEFGSVGDSAGLLLRWYF